MVELRLLPALTPAGEKIPNKELEKPVERLDAKRYAMPFFVFIFFIFGVDTAIVLMLR